MKKKHFFLLALSAILFSIPRNTVFADPPGDEKTTTSQNSGEQAENPSSNASYDHHDSEDSEDYHVADWWVWVTFPNQMPRKIYLTEDTDLDEEISEDPEITQEELSFRSTTLRGIVAAFFRLHLKILREHSEKSYAMTEATYIHCFVNGKLIPKPQWDLSLSEIGIQHQDKIVFVRENLENKPIRESFWKRQSDNFGKISSEQLMKDKFLRPIFRVQDSTVNQERERLMLINPRRLHRLGQILQERQEFLEEIQVFHASEQTMNLTLAERPNEEALPILW